MFTSVINTEMNLLILTECLLSALLCGVMMAFANGYNDEQSQSRFVSLCLLPCAICMTLMLINGSVGTALAIGGVFSLIRFKSVAAKAKDILALFLVMCEALACSAGYLGVAILFGVFSSLLLMGLMSVPFVSRNARELTMSVAEDLNYAEAFEEVFAQYCKSWDCYKIKTTHMGSMFKLYYRLEMKSGADSKAMINDLRVRNGNLEIVLMDRRMEEEL